MVYHVSHKSFVKETPTINPNTNPNPDSNPNPNPNPNRTPKHVLPNQ